LLLFCFLSFVSFSFVNFRVSLDFFVAAIMKVLSLVAGSVAVARWPLQFVLLGLSLALLANLASAAAAPDQVEELLASKTHYEILGLESTATLPEIKRAFRAKSLEFHPDKIKSNSEEERAVSQAYFLRAVEGKRGGGPSYAW